MILGGVSGVPSDDPNSQSASSQNQLNEDLNQFLTLLITQLENQDPLEPLETSEFTSQLVQFASVEQQIQQNANIEELIALQSAGLVSNMVNFIGTTIEASGQVVPLENENAEFTYALENNAKDVTISIRNAAGLNVYTTQGELTAGKHNYTWDGKDANGVAQPDGPYTVIVSAQDFEGNLANVSHTIFGRITSAGAENGTVTLFMGKIPTTMDHILSINENPNEPETPAS
jgi:flagellar basal-body rod modification protein FlgD